MRYRPAALVFLFAVLCTEGVANAQSTADTTSGSPQLSNATLQTQTTTMGQTQTGASLSGVVTDQTGAALRDVAVTIKNVDTGATRTITTDGGGHYQASGLPLGRFEIRAAKQGFADETRTGISLAVGQDATVDIKMQRSTPDACASGHEFAHHRLHADLARHHAVRCV